MADPARYHLDPLLDNNEAKLHVERSGSGDWVKWADFVDYKAAQRRNKAADSITQMGIEIAELRSQLVDLAAENERLRKAGDEFYDYFICYHGEDIVQNKKHYSGQMCRDWLAAKEGRDAK